MLTYQSVYTPSTTAEKCPDCMLENVNEWKCFLRRCLEPFNSVYFHHFHSAKVVSREYDLPLVQFFRSPLHEPAMEISQKFSTVHQVWNCLILDSLIMTFSPLTGIKSLSMHFSLIQFSFYDFPFFHFDREKIASVYFYEVLSFLFLLIEF